MDDFAVHFPWMNPKLAGVDVPAWVRWLDPGVPVAGDASRWRSPDLPFSDVEIRRLVRDYVQFAERFPKAADMQAYRATGLDNFYTDTTMDILSQLTGGEKPTEATPTDRLRQAQIVLALALFREEHFLAMHEQEARFEQARDGFAQVLGLDDEEPFADFDIPDEALFPRASVDLPWKGLLAPMLALLPAGARLFVSDPDVRRELAASELTFAPCVVDGQDLLCCDLDADGLERVCGERVEVSLPVRIVATP